MTRRAARTEPARCRARVHARVWACKTHVTCSDEKDPSDEGARLLIYAHRLLVVTLETLSRVR